jgi:phenylacetate-coenzyme A ligase PaaK-like adenylate-forming protein
MVQQDARLRAESVGHEGGEPPATSDFEVIRQRHVRALQERLPAEVEKLTWPLERLHALRDQRLRALVHTARTHSPWHARRLRHIDPDTLSGSDLSAIPPMTKADLMANWDEIVTDRRLTLDLTNRHLAQVAEHGPAYLQGEYRAIVSGGTSGMRGTFVWDFQGWLEAMLEIVRHDLWVPPGAAPHTIARQALIASPSPLHFSAAMLPAFGNPVGTFASFPATLPTAELVARLNDYQPDMIHTFPSALRRLAREARPGALRIAPRLLGCGGEPLSLETRQVIEEAFGAPIVDDYVCSEINLMAASCPGVPALHLVEDTAVYEPVDREYRPVPAGTPAAKLLVTNVINRVQPLIRYEITDGVTFLDGPNPDPWTGRRIAPVRGRLEDVFVYPGGIELPPIVFAAVLEPPAGILEFQVRQTERGAEVAVRTTAKVPFEPLTRQLVEAMRRPGLADPEVRLTVVTHIEQTPGSGKLRRYIPLKSS